MMQPLQGCSLLLIIDSGSRLTTTPGYYDAASSRKSQKINIGHKNRLAGPRLHRLLRTQLPA
uniref:Uncharacterized protein n=1 Tax=Candidatus Kentrum sp. MB TaxID=2138164 RepID=A0A450XX93_9GAMM|nr:MAG: hypothetical protein BECKMB1821G_GA0114241_11961 [Candidatus Kentron sp. MB]VFK36128.1 MAG: hypothetical protein BECKMB1821I_GA0114274_12071 [Candidatus Kentron sp. MB]VFK77656.1 MAG: hypothetical protein BECKMB1821H_GA0114242_12021 [Candidatus Kentron sp. MB]